MSWAEEDWTVGLSGKVLSKVKELQVHHERLSRENKQKQLLLDNIQRSLEKQTAKFEEVRVELQLSHRELQRVQEVAQAAVDGKERVSQDLQSKQAQVFSLEGQLDAAWTLNSKLTQEVKRLEAELEKLENSSRAAETTLFSTPCWSSPLPWELSGSKKEERHGKGEEGKTQAHVRRLQFGDRPSSSLSRQQPKGAHQTRTPDVYSTPSAAFPWEREDTPARRPSPESPITSYSDALSRSREQDVSVTTNSPNNSETQLAAVSDLRSHLADVEKALRAKEQTLNTIQNEVAQNKKQLTAKELSLQKLRDELSLAHTRKAQEGERASTAEQKAKQLQEELKCQRQNAESSRVQHQQRTKELERQHQRDLQEFQKERQFMERQHQQEINKLNQELAQARALHNTLQAQLDKVSLEKQAAMKEVDSLKEKLKWTEGQLDQSQKKETLTQTKLTETVRETEALTVSLRQSQKKESALEEDRRRLTEERDHAQCLLKELQEQKAASAPLHHNVPVCSIQSSSQTSISHASQHPTRKPKPVNVVRQNAEEVNRNEEKPTPRPTDREPGEGIDSDHISINLQSENCGLQSKRGGLLEANLLQSAAETSLSHTTKQTIPSEVLQAENASLRSELSDVREELQKRLDDLEVQRQAEAEARTRLKQLSRKNAKEISEKKEQYMECKAQMERERSEVERLKKAMANLESEMRDRQGKTENQKEEKNNMPQDTEDEMVELNMQLKRQLSEVKAQLVLEREEREQLEKEITTNDRSDTDLNVKIQELEAEIKRLKFYSNKSSEEEALSAANSPVTYLTLRDDELNSNNVDPSEKPETLTLCEPINEDNTEILASSEYFTQPIVTQRIFGESRSSSSADGEQKSLNQELKRNKSPSEEEEDSKLSVLKAQVQSLQKQNVIEKERSNQSNVKLQLLQKEVTQQTQQLTVAFERQSQHISSLLVELQEKENTILRTERELKLCKQELDALKREITKHDHDKETLLLQSQATVDNDGAEGTVELIPDAEPPVLDNYQQVMVNVSDSARLENEVSIDGDRSSCGQREDVLLKLKNVAVTSLRPTAINTDGVLDNQTPKAVSDYGVRKCIETQQSCVELKEHEEEREDRPEAGSQRLDQISHLQQQVVALQSKLLALSEENSQKTQELALWKLSSESVAELRHSAQECVTVMRGDEILLSCSSNKLQGRSLFTRIQQNPSLELKSPPTSVLQDRSEDNSESDKENTSPSRLHQRNDTRDIVDHTCPPRTEVRARRSSITRAACSDVRSISTQTESLSVSPVEDSAPLQTVTPGAEEDVPQSMSPVLLGEGQKSKDPVMLTASFPIPADPASLAERIRRSRTQLSAAFDDTEYEPYGLPEVVMKGFADIPTGPSCPYIVRRGLLGTTAVPVPTKNLADTEETD